MKTIVCKALVIQRLFILKQSEKIRNELDKTFIKKYISYE